MGEGDTLREIKKTRVICEECGTTMADLSLHHRIERAHGIFMPQARGVGVGGGRPETYMVSFPRVLKSVACLVGRCPVRAHKPGRIRENFM